MILQKWNPDTHIYEPFDSPAVKTILFPKDATKFQELLNTVIDCAECWKEVVYWETYTSLQIHTELWLWYPVCESCYYNERK